MLVGLEASSSSGSLPQVVRVKDIGMRTGRVHQPGPLLSPGGQKGRLIFLVVVLAFMLYSIHWASQGRHWTWLVPSPSEPSGVEPALREFELKLKAR